MTAGSAGRMALPEALFGSSLVLRVARVKAPRRCRQGRFATAFRRKNHAAAVAGARLCRPHGEVKPIIVLLRNDNAGRLPCRA